MDVLEQNIMEALVADPRVNPDAISVQAFGGDVAVLGLVDLASQRGRPGRDAIGLDEMRVTG
jgi:hypothetical protein